MTDAQLEVLAMFVHGPAIPRMRQMRSLRVLLRLGYMQPTSSIPFDKYEITPLGRLAYDNAMGESESP